MKYLVVGPSWVGDMVMAQALFMSLKQQDPQAEIDVLAPGWSLPIIARMPEVNTGIAAPWKSGELALKAQWRLARTLKGYDKAIVLPRSFKSSLIPFFAGIPERVGFSGEGRSILLTDARRRHPTRAGSTITDKTVWRYLGLGASKADYETYRFDVPQPSLTIDKANLNDVMGKLGLDPRSEEHTSELQSRPHLVCRLLLEKKKMNHRSVCGARFQDRRDAGPGNVAYNDTTVRLAPVIAAHTERRAGRQRQHMGHDVALHVH